MDIPHCIDCGQPATRPALEPKFCHACYEEREQAEEEAIAGEIVGQEHGWSWDWKPF
jgi:hypothetical protein